MYKHFSYIHVTVMYYSLFTSCCHRIIFISTFFCTFRCHHFILILTNFVFTLPCSYLILIFTYFFITITSLYYILHHSILHHNIITYFISTYFIYTFLLSLLASHHHSYLFIILLHKHIKHKPVTIIYGKLYSYFQVCLTCIYYNLFSHQHFTT